MAFSTWLGSTLVFHRPPPSTVSIATDSPSVRRSRSDMPETSRLASTTCGAKRLLAREGEQPGGQIGGARGCVRRGFDELADVGLAARQLALDQVHGAGDDREHVVEIMRDAAGELADRFHLLHLPHLRFRRLARG